MFKHDRARELDGLLMIWDYSTMAKPQQWQQQSQIALSWRL